MKKKLAVVLTAIMVLTMGTTVSAAPSPTTDTTNTVAEVAAYANVAVAPEGVVIDGVASAVAPTIAPVTTAQVEAAQAQAGVLVAPTAKVLQMVDVSLPVSFTKVQLTFNVDGVVKGQKLAVLHQLADGSWEAITPDAVENGTVTATFTSLSPVAIVAYNVSAKTGETAPIMPIIAVACLAGIVVCGKKVKFNN